MLVTEYIDEPFGMLETDKADSVTAADNKIQKISPASNICH